MGCEDKSGDKIYERYQDAECAAQRFPVFGLIQENRLFSGSNLNKLDISESAGSRQAYSQSAVALDGLKYARIASCHVETMCA